MIKSMTGYGKAEAILESGKITIEIRTLNGKTADVNLKTSLFPKDKELLIRQKIAEQLQRGTIDIFVQYEPNAADSAKKINADLMREYYNQITSIVKELDYVPMIKPEMSGMIVSSILKFPDVLDNKKVDVITEENWPVVEDAVNQALAKVNEYRSKEGVALYNDVVGRVHNIEALENEVESYEKERLDAVREKIQKALEELKQNPDPNRFEQEMVYYLEKLDINEEKVRLRQHCKYFLDTIDSDPTPGKKLGFIIQEMGREINTTGSKANHSGIQKAVVKMKDELEKIREQSLNIL